MGKTPGRDALIGLTLLGTGWPPQADDGRFGPASLVTHAGRSCLVDCGSGVIAAGRGRRAGAGGLLRPPPARDSGVIVRALLRYGFVIALVIILAGFIHAGVRAYIESRERLVIATTPTINVAAIVDTDRDQIAASTEREEAYRE